MIKAFTALWILGLITLIPYGTYYLFFEATREQYALIIVSILFWIFGYWSVVGPIISAFKIRSLMKTLESLQSEEEIKALVTSDEARESAINLIASENRIPKFIAKRVLDLLIKAFQEKDTPST